MKKLSALLLTAVILLSSFSFAANAAEEYRAVINAQFGQTAAREMLDLINGLRQSDDAWYWNENNTEKVVLSGLSALVYDYQLERTAMQRAAEIAVYYSHTRPNGESCWTAYEGSYYTAGENIAYGFNTFESVFEAWSEEDEDYSGQGHRRNMLNSNFSAVAVGHVIMNGRHYWVQEFRSPASGESFSEPQNGVKAVTFPFSKSVVGCGNFTVKETEISLGLGETAVPEISYTVNSRTVSPAGITGQTENENVAVVKDGVITPTGTGMTVITVSAFGESADISVTVHPEKDVHVWNDGEIIKAPACTDAGSKKYTCTVCGETKTETIPAIGHNYGIWNSDGDKTHSRVCRNDKSHIETVEHQWEDVILAPATCTERGSKFCTCVVCGETKTESIPAAGHSFGDWIITSEASYTETGVKERKCEVCSETETEIIPVLVPEYVKGDADMDGAITASDARIALRIAVKIIPAEPGSPEFLACDVDSSGSINAYDARAILRAAVGIENL